ncbi:programmed cell death protein 7 [Brachyhypopomus gauderio]|uniref:programmed cell death protein 7 n=1 Tax=Brachyhypopomus gauderio TaxID=698409 RepID=UPI0040424615
MDPSQQYYYSEGTPPTMGQPPPMPPGSLPPGAEPPWNVYQHPPPVPPNNWPPFQPMPLSGPQYRPQPTFDPTRPPPGYFEAPQLIHGSSASQIPFQAEHEHQSGSWSCPAGGEYRTGIDSYSRGPFAAFQPNSNSDSLGQNFIADYRAPSGFARQPSEGPWSMNYQNNKENSQKTSVISDEDARQRMQDEQWIKSFVLKRGKPAAETRSASRQSVSEFKEKLYGTVKMVSELSEVCRTLKNNLENESAWTDSYSRAMELKTGLQDRLAALQDPECFSGIKKKLALLKKKRARMRRKKVERMEESQEREARAAEREAAIDKYQSKQILELEEKNRERELKLAADAVLSEVRKKQADAKRMLDILRALEKLRKLRKEAAARKGMFPEKECDDVFERHVARLRDLIRKRTAVYGAEEKALRVMLEGEQEEERRRDREKRLKKEKDRFLQRKREIDAMLFGAELPPDHPLQPFYEYYTQAEHSLPSLIQIRREWDQFLVPEGHPDGTSIPQGWVLPDPPADDVWATALEK